MFFPFQHSFLREGVGGTISAFTKPVTLVASIDTNKYQNTIGQKPRTFLRGNAKKEETEMMRREV